MVLTIPRETLEARLGSVGPVTAREDESCQSNCRTGMGISFIFPAGAIRLMVQSGLRSLNKLSIWLLRRFQVETQQSGSTLSSSRATTLLRLKSVIESRLCEPDLKPAAVAAETGERLNPLLLGLDD